jgi:hypothetical protein
MAYADLCPDGPIRFVWVLGDGLCRAILRLPGPYSGERLQDFVKFQSRSPNRQRGRPVRG